VPKVDVFAGYQWLNPGATSRTLRPYFTPFKVPSITGGFGTAVTYNFAKNWGLVDDFGSNYRVK